MKNRPPNGLPFAKAVKFQAKLQLRDYDTKPTPGAPDIDVVEAARVHPEAAITDVRMENGAFHLEECGVATASELVVMEATELIHLCAVLPTSTIWAEAPKDLGVCPVHNHLVDEDRCRADGNRLLREKLAEVDDRLLNQLSPKILLEASKTLLAVLSLHLLEQIDECSPHLCGNSH